MNNNIKSFIEKNIHLINSNQFEKLYKDPDLSPSYRGELSDVFLTAGIDFLSFMKEIPKNCFYYSEALTELTIPENIEQIGGSAFEHSSLTSVFIPDSVMKIEDSVFGDCTRLTSITIPDSVTSIGDYAFYYCTSLTSVTIPNRVTSIGERVFYNCTGLTSVTIGDSVTSIGSCSFCSCINLTSITIPGSVTSIGSYAFTNCTKLTEIIFKGTKLEWNSVKKYRGFYKDLDNLKIYCTDGVINRRRHN